MDHTKQAVSIFDKLAERYQEKFMDVSLYHEALDVFLTELSGKKPNVLDVACGPGNVAKYLLSKNSNLQLLCTDLSPRMLELGKINNPQAEFKLLDSRNILSLDQKFDGIICSFCFPYFSKEETIQFINDTVSMLNPKGLLYISTMEDRNDKSGFEKSSSGDEVFMNYHEEGYLLNALAQNNFLLLHRQYKNYIHNGKDTRDLLLVAKKQSPVT
jgi:ubiquinone/menaquinone biosynthesis C-methylase UbiE